MIEGRVSVIMAVFNGADLIGEAIAGLRNQTHPDVEVIIVDDGSTDDTPAVVATHEDVVYVRQENAGQVAARRRGLGLATGEFIAFNDHDDVMLPERLERQLAFLRDHPEVGCVLCRHEVENVDGSRDVPDWVPRDLVYGDISGVEWTSMLAPRANLEAEYFVSNAQTADGMRVLTGLRDAGHRIEVLDEKLWMRRYRPGNKSADRDVIRHDLLEFLRNRARSTGST